MIDQIILLGTIGTLGYFTLHRIIEWLKIKAMKGVYFHGKTVLITGASGGLGKAIAEEMYPLGAQLILCARNKEQLEQVKKDLIKSGPGKEPEVLVLDVASGIEIVQEKMNSMYSRFGRIDVLVNNAGLGHRGESYNTSGEIYQKVFDVNYFGVVRLTNLVVNQMIKDNEQMANANVHKRSYSIVNIGSVQSYLGLPYRSAYGSSKHALLAYSDSLRSELYLHKNIDIVNCQPGYINTNKSLNDLTNNGSTNGTPDEDHKKGFEPNYVAKVVIDSILLKEKENLITVISHRIALMIRFFLPNIFAAMMSSRAKKQNPKKSN